MKIKELINKLQKLEEKHGNVNVNIYGSYSKETKEINDVYFDEDLNDVYFGIYF